MRPDLYLGRELPVLRGSTERSVKYEESVDSFTPFAGLQGGVNKFETTNEIDFSLYRDEAVHHHPVAQHQHEPVKNEIFPTLPPVSSVSVFPNEARSRTKTRPKQDAYLFSVEDPDEGWTTLPSRKKKKPKSSLSRICTFLPRANAFHVLWQYAYSISCAEVYEAISFAGPSTDTEIGENAR
jgi:hypothetical protein